jgi:NADPH-dependent 2,4-dienoyl-CoA reductase/sulfur reductase-like enzyme
MQTYQYIIIGGGMTGSAAVMGIRKNDPEGSIAMFSKENYGPYNRPPLTKSLWDGKEIESIMRPLDQYNVDMYLDTTIKTIDPDQKVVTTTKGDHYQYHKLLLATGGDPIPLPGAPEDVIYYRTRSDFHYLKELTQKKDRFCVIGGGFIGSELAAALNKTGKDVTLIFPEDGICATLFPQDLATFLVTYYRENGVQVLNNHLVDSITKQGETFIVKYHQVDNDQAFQENFDGVIAGIGIRPNTSLAEEASIPVQDGILVDEFLRTDAKDVYAAGDVANFKHVPLKKRVRVEHEDNANTMGMTAGLNMSGGTEKYDHFPFFYSDLFDLGYEAVGEINPELEVFEDWIDPFKKGTIFYLNDDKIRGLIFWNLWGKVDEGREVIEMGKSYNKSELSGMFTE